MPTTEMLRLVYVLVPDARHHFRRAADSRCHLALALGLSVALLLNHQLLFQAGIFVVQLLALWWWGMSPREISRTIWPVLTMMGLTILYHHLFPVAPEAVAGSSSPTIASFARGLFFSFRLGGLYLAVLPLARIVSPDELADAFIVLLRPLRALGIQVTTFILAIRAAIASIPALQRNLRDYQQSFQMQNTVSADGAPAAVRNLRRTAALFSPMLILVARRADHLSLALRARGYRQASGMTMFTDLRWTMRDSLTVCVSLFLIGLLWRVSV